MSLITNTRRSLNKTRHNRNRNALSRSNQPKINMAEITILKNKLGVTTTDINNLLQNIISEVEKPVAFNMFNISGIKVNKNITNLLDDIDKKIKTKISDKEYYNSLLNTILSLKAKFLNLLFINELTYENINNILNEIPMSNILSDELEGKINKLSISNNKLVINNIQHNVINNKHNIKGDVQIPRTLLLLAILATACSASMSDTIKRINTGLIKRGGTYYNHHPPSVGILRASRRLIPLLVRFPQLLVLLFIFIIWNTLSNIWTGNEPISPMVEDVEIVEETQSISEIPPAAAIMNAELLAPPRSASLLLASPVSASPLSQQDPYVVARSQRRWQKLPLRLKLPSWRPWTPGSASPLLASPRSASPVSQQDPYVVARPQRRWPKLPSWRPWTKRNQPAPQGGSRKKRRN